MKPNKAIFFIILLVTVLLTLVAVFGIHSPVMNIDIKGAGDMRWGIDIRGGVDAVFEPKDLGRAPTADELASARAIIETRLDNLNILDRDVTSDSIDGKIFVRFPWKTGETEFDPGEAIRELGEMAELSFREPDGTVVLTGKNVIPNTHVQRDQNGMYYVVAFELDAEGSDAFAEATGRLVGQQISIYMDETLISDPVVNDRIDGGSGIITGQFTQRGAQDLANKINAGSLPFSLESTNYSAISPMLGSNALEVMLWAGLVAFALICLFLLIYYRLSGLVAVIGLTLQLTGLMLILSISQITVTLQGIAGIILTIGMGVDANVVIAERIREELRAGKALDSAITAGFKRAFSAVFDGNLTTLLVAVVMMIFGSGAILSFAYTLLLGILMNFVTGVFANRLMTQSVTRLPAFRKNVCFLSEKSLKHEVKVRDFFGKRRIFYAISAVVILLGVIMCFTRGVKLDVQFAGGAIFRYTIERPDEMDPDAAAALVGNVLDGRPVTGQVTQAYGESGTRLVLTVAAGEDLSNEDVIAFETVLRENFPQQNFQLAEFNNVNSFYSDKFLRNGIIAIALSFLLILLYVWFSFRRIHGLSAAATGLLALLHDVAVVFFSFVIFGIPIGDTFIAVMLTILGYSINDTIIVYDRVRENALFDPSTPVEQLINCSLSQTLARTINTSLSTLGVMITVYIFSTLYGLVGIQSFALPMIVGMVSGCYSTVCLCGPIWVTWQKAKQRSALAKKKKRA
ncbi:MAG: protein translocase subunit SecF [Oscillospiraceae bacterium]|nr:protein translocase subunit SecF [Oscillospiraceae bacterium]